VPLQQAILKWAASIEEDNMAEHLIELRKVTKSFGSVNAIEDVSFYVDEGEVIGLIGDNGAGKSTLIKILSGVHAPDSGEIYIRGEKANGWNSAKSRESGIETVYQDRALVVNQTIVRNIFMGRELRNRLGFIAMRRQHEEAERLMRDIGFTSKVFSPNSLVATLSGGERQGVAIARALYYDADLIVLDEPTTALSLTETQKVFSFVENVRNKGRSIVFIDHNIYHVYDIADRFVILDRGRVVAEATRAEVGSAEALMDDMRSIARTGHVAREDAGLHSPRASH
jgi:simple sugar transport system ATP-binding protein